MPKRPNILVILSDQQRWDTVECYGQPLHPNLTPHLDALAGTGVRFHHAFTCQPVCGPVRSTLQTGLYPTQTGCFINNRALPLDAVTIAKLLSGAGYETGYIGKWHLASDAQNNHETKPIPPERRGGYKDLWLAADVLEFTSSGYEGYMYDAQNNRVDFEGYRVDCTANFAIDYLRQYATRKPDKPFFLFTSIIEPHHQNDLNRYIGPIGSKQRFSQYKTPPDLVGTEGDWRQHLPDYLGCCWSIDQNVGRIREQLNLLGLAEDTLVIYTSDHGCHFRTRNHEYKRSCHEDSIRVPLIIHGPAHTGFTGGRVFDDLVSLIDLPETILHAAGVAIPSPMRGRPMQQLVDGGMHEAWPDEVYVQISESQTGRAVRTRQWKYGVDGVTADGVPHKNQFSDHYVEQYLYNLDADPAERNNLVEDASLTAVRAELAARLQRRMQHAGEPPAEIRAAV